MTLFVAALWSVKFNSNLVCLLRFLLKDSHYYGNYIMDFLQGLVPLEGYILDSTTNCKKGTRD